MIYLALGDSITYGYDATDEHNRYPSVLAHRLREFGRTSLYVHAKPGWTSEKLLQSLEQIPHAIIEEASLITLMIGGNDLLHAMPWFLDDPQKAKQRFSGAFRSRILAIIRRIKRNPDALFLICTVYNPFPKTEIAKEAVAWLNEMLKDIARSEQCLLVPVHHSYDGAQDRLVQGYKNGDLSDFRLMRNPIHPNDEGHRQIASVLFDYYQRYLKERQAKDAKTRQRNRISAKKRRDKRGMRV